MFVGIKRQDPNKNGTCKSITRPMHIFYPLSEIFCVFKLSFRLNTLFKTNYNLKKTVIVRQTLTQHELSWHCFDKKVDYKKTIDNFLTVKSQSLLQLMKSGKI